MENTVVILLSVIAILAYLWGAARRDAKNKAELILKLEAENAEFRSEINRERKLWTNAAQTRAGAMPIFDADYIDKPEPEFPDPFPPERNDKAFENVGIFASARNKWQKEDTLIELRKGLPPDKAKEIDAELERLREN